LSAGSTEFSVPPWATTAIADLGQIAEHEQILPAYSLRINDFERLLPALLQVKADLQPLPEGTFRLGLDLDGKKAVYALTYGYGQATADRPDGPADLVLDRLTATRLLFGPLPPMLMLPQLAQQPDLARLLTCWLPLAFYGLPRRSVMRILAEVDQLLLFVDPLPPCSPDPGTGGWVRGCACP
jgi:hypothetical protein